MNAEPAFDQLIWLVMSGDDLAGVRPGQAIYNTLPVEICARIIHLRDAGVEGVDPYEISDRGAAVAWLHAWLIDRNGTLFLREDYE